MRLNALCSPVHRCKWGFVEFQAVTVVHIDMTSIDVVVGDLRVGLCLSKVGPNPNPGKVRGMTKICAQGESLPLVDFYILKILRLDAPHSLVRHLQIPLHQTPNRQGRAFSLPGLLLVVFFHMLSELLILDH